MASARDSLWYQVKKNWLAYLYISPFYILFVVFGLFPILFSFFLSFNSWDGIGKMQWVGLSNYVALLKDRLFWRALINTLVYIGLITHIIMLSLALIIAFLINSEIVRYKDFFKIAYFAPNITSSVAVSIIFLTLYGVQYGLINYILQSIGLKPIDWWGGTGFWVKPAIMILFIWRWLGWNVVIYLAGLQSIPTELYDAAKVDGASLFQVFRHITIPLLRPVILFSVILSIIGTITTFDEPYMLVGSMGGTNNAGLTLGLYLYLTGFEWGKFGYASALSYLMFILIVIISIINWRIFSRRPTQ
jgi:ABC-type sugar transport system permease subunit